MKKLILVPATFLLILFILSCGSSKKVATAPVVTVVAPIEKDRIINKSFDAVWQSIIELLATYNMPIKNLDKNSGFISTDYKAVTGNASVYMNCTGASPTYMERTDLVDAGGNLNVLVKKITEDSTKVTVNTFYSCTSNKYRAENIVSTNYVLISSTRTDCTSTGNLEKAILDYLAGK